MISEIANFLVPILLIVNLLLNFAMEQLPCLVTEEKHGELGMHEGAYGTFCIDTEEIWNCRLIALVQLKFH